jgi:hypothetical protein
MFVFGATLELKPNSKPTTFLEQRRIHRAASGHEDKVTIVQLLHARKPSL